MRESAHLQREAEAQRAGLSNTLGQLRDGMTTSALSAELVGVLRDSSLTLDPVVGLVLVPSGLRVYVLLVIGVETGVELELDE